MIVNREAARRVRDGGAIVNLSSSTVGAGSPTHGPHAVSNAAADVLTHVLAIELRDRDIAVNAVLLDIRPGTYPTVRYDCSRDGPTPVVVGRGARLPQS